MKEASEDRKNRRRSERLEVSDGVTGRIKPTMEVRILNISQHGMLLESPCGLPPKGMCELTIEAPGGPRLIKAKVARCRAQMVKQDDGNTAIRFHAGLEFPGTYYLAYRDLPLIISHHVRGDKALDFGCGTGRSSRFLKGLGFEVAGVDISPNMIHKARELDPEGEYFRVAEGDLMRFPAGSHNLVLSVFTFDNIPTMEMKVKNFRQIARVLKTSGRLVHLVSSPDIYLYEWASFSTRDFPENRKAASGDRVKIIMTDVSDPRPVEDVMCSHDDYLSAYSQSGLKVVDIHKPLARETEPFSWITETRIPPWVIYVLKKG